MAEPALFTLVRCEVRWKRTTGVASDDQLNTFFVSSATEGTAPLSDAAQGAAANMRNYLDSRMPASLFTSTPIAEVTTFNMLDPEPRVPIEVITMDTVSLSAAQALPEEVSLVVSFQGVPISGQSMRQRRGRMYLPTMVVTELDDNTSTIWKDNAVSNAVDMMTAIKSDLEAASCHLVVFSRVAAAAAGGTLLNQARAGATIVTNGWVDNEPDTQRRRGRPGGTKTVWS
jgi:hypothetical protein